MDVLQQSSFGYSAMALASVDHRISLVLANSTTHHSVLKPSRKITTSIGIFNSPIAWWQYLSIKVHQPREPNYLDIFSSLPFLQDLYIQSFWPGLGDKDGFIPKVSMTSLEQLSFTQLEELPVSGELGLLGKEELRLKQEKIKLRKKSSTLRTLRFKMNQPIPMQTTQL